MSSARYIVPDISMTGERKKRREKRGREKDRERERERRV
jgi:hypothetical protein